MSTSPLLDRPLQRRRLVEVLDDHLVDLGRVVARVLVVGLEHGLLAGLVVGDRVAAGADHLVGRLDLVGRVLGRRDRRAAGGEQEGPGRVRRLEVEDHRRVVGRLDALQVQIERGRALRVGDLEVAVERRLDVLGGEVRAVGELEAALERALVDGARVVGEVARLGRLRLGLVAARRDLEQVLVDVEDHVVGRQVVRRRRGRRRPAGRSCPVIRTGPRRCRHRCRRFRRPPGPLRAPRPLQPRRRTDSIRPMSDTSSLRHRVAPSRRRPLRTCQRCDCTFSRRAPPPARAGRRGGGRRPSGRLRS